MQKSAGSPYLASGRSPKKVVTELKEGSYAKAVHDLRQGLPDYWELWVTVGRYDIVKRYRRSLLGPFWITQSGRLHCRPKSKPVNHRGTFDTLVVAPPRRSLCGCSNIL